MSNQEVGHTSTEERPAEQSQVVEMPQPATPIPPERPIEQAAQPSQYSPYNARQNYYPGPGQQPYYGPYLMSMGSVGGCQYAAIPALLK